MTDELMDFDTDDSGSGGFRPSRRTVLAAAAWTVPAVVIAQAAPALAASGDPVNIVVVGNSACKFPGNGTIALKGYAFSLQIENKLPCSTNVQIISMTMDGVAQQFNGASLVGGTATSPSCTSGNAYLGSPQAIGSGATQRIAVYTDENGNSQSGDLVVTYTYTTCAPNSTTVTATTTKSLVGSPWTGGCRPFGYTSAQWDAAATNCPTFAK